MNRTTTGRQTSRSMWATLFACIMVISVAVANPAAGQDYPGPGVTEPVPVIIEQDDPDGGLEYYVEAHATNLAVDPEEIDDWAAVQLEIRGYNADGVNAVTHRSQTFLPGTADHTAAVEVEPGWTYEVDRLDPRMEHPTVYWSAEDLVDFDQAPFWGGTVDRIGGLDRYRTASMLAGVWGTPGNTCVNIAQGRDAHVIDSITGGQMSARVGMSVATDGAVCGNWVNLLVRDGGLPSATVAMLNHLQPPSITVLGGESAVSEQVREQLRGYTTGDVNRLGGTNRYGTAAEIARAAAAGGMDTSTVFLANGQGNDLANALAAAGLGRHPVLLVRQDSVPGITAEVLAELNPTHIVVVGNRDSVSDQVYVEAGATARIDGATHEQVAVNLVNAYLDSAAEVFVVRDDIFADGLAVSVLPGPVVTVRGDLASDQLVQALNYLDTFKVTVAGGTHAVSEHFANSLREASRAE